MKRAPAALERMALRVAKLRGRSKLQHALVLADAMDEAGWIGNTIPTGRRLRQFYDVIALDVWGNYEDGYTINDERRVGGLIVPVDETLSNVRHVRDAFLGTKDPRAVNLLYHGREPLTLALERAVHREWLAGGVHLDDVEIIDIYGDGSRLEVQLQGRPVLHLRPGGWGRS